MDAKDFTWDDELLDEDSDVPVVYTPDDILACVEKIFNYVAENLNTSQYDPSPSRQIFVIELDTKIDKLLLARNDKSFSLESRLQLFDILRERFAEGQNSLVLHRFDKVVNSLIPPSDKTYLNVVEMLLDDNGISLMDERERDSISVEVLVKFNPISLMPPGLKVSS